MKVFGWTKILCLILTGKWSFCPPVREVVYWIHSLWDRNLPVFIFFVKFWWRKVTEGLLVSKGDMITYLCWWMSLQATWNNLNILLKYPQTYFSRLYYSTQSSFSVFSCIEAVSTFCTHATFIPLFTIIPLHEAFSSPLLAFEFLLLF